MNIQINPTSVVVTYLRPNALPVGSDTSASRRTLFEIVPVKRKDIQMTREELKDKLNKMSDKEFIDFVKDYKVLIIPIIDAS